MQSENFDSKVRQAAEQHHPNYDEKAWSKMEKLLDRHLPQKGDRRRIIFLLLFFLFIGGGVWLFISKPWSQNNRSLSVTNTPAKNETEPSAKTTKETTERPIEENSPVIESPADEPKARFIENAGNNKQVKNKNFIVVPGKVTNSSVRDKVLPRKDNKTDQLETDITNPAVTKQDNNTPVNNANPVVAVPATSNDKVTKNDNTKIKTDQPLINDVPANKTVEMKKDNINEQPEKTDKKETAKKSNSKKHNSFFFSFSAGPDISSVNFNNQGKIKLLTGAGFGYTFKNRLTIRTGFYTASKVYTASKYDYKPAGGIMNPMYLDKIDADCKVYEIPLNLSYNFSKSTKNSLFATVGLSSFIMKKEVYKYLYKYPGTPPTTYTYTKTLNNENKHYFSVLTISGGYQHKINKTFSIAAEPYFKLPLTGVGFGKVKLNSAGILFSVNVAPFQPAAKK